MVTATKLPFSLSVIRTFAYEPGGQAVTAEKEATKFVLFPGANSLTDAATVFIRENEGVELVFKSADAGARLYLPCLDVAEDAGRVLHDDAGDYIAPSAEPFRLCGAGKEGLLVERMAFFVLAEGTRYYGSFEVAPRQLDHSEWKIMQQELEAEFEGLSRSWKKGQAGSRRSRSARSGISSASRPKRANSLPHFLKSESNRATRLRLSTKRSP